ncbi:MAG: histidinol-phosphate aminotransferase family protein [Clostridia bacterium]|nr:histidinol-phosphate aminotransferase family protein [Clostridia bacterium]
MKHGGNVWQGEKPGDWLDYSANLRPGGPPDWVRAALQSAMENARYYPDPRMRRATEAMAAYLGISPGFVRPTAGGISAIQLANRLPSAETLILTPCFCEYEQFASSPVRRLSLLQKRHEIALPEDLQLRKNSLVWLCNPLNPVGTAFPRAQIEKLLQQAEEAEGWLIVDEAFIEYCPEHSIADLIGKHGRLLVAGSMTKILGIPGVRLGCLCAQPQVLAELEKYQLTWELSCFAEAVACALPEHREEILADSRENARNRAWLKAALEGMGIFTYPSEAAFLLADFGRDVQEISEKLRERRILVRSCMNFDGINDGHHLRLAVKDAASNQRFIQALREVLLCAENH